MAEATQDATLLIATSWQALGRAETGDERTIICNCTVSIVFAGFFIEANLNHIIEEMNETEAMNQYLRKDRPGLQGKLAWFYSSHIAESQYTDKREIYLKLRDHFPGFGEIYDFRNSISHGVIDRAKANPDDAKRLREMAKTIVDELFEAAKRAGHDIHRGVTYEVAIASSDLPSKKE
jgi:hypothetical protein